MPKAHIACSRPPRTPVPISNNCSLLPPSNQLQPAFRPCVSVCFVSGIYNPVCVCVWRSIVLQVISKLHNKKKQWKKDFYSMCLHQQNQQQLPTIVFLKPPPPPLPKKPFKVKTITFVCVFVCVHFMQNSELHINLVDVTLFLCPLSTPTPNKKKSSVVLPFRFHVCLSLSIYLREKCVLVCVCVCVYVLWTTAIHRGNIFGIPSMSFFFLSTGHVSQLDTLLAMAERCGGNLLEKIKCSPVSSLMQSFYASFGEICSPSFC